MYSKGLMKLVEVVEEGQAILMARIFYFVFYPENVLNLTLKRTFFKFNGILCSAALPSLSHNILQVIIHTYTSFYFQMNPLQGAEED